MATPADPHLILVGLPGAGKSTVGRAVAAKLGRDFVDLDVEIERVAAMSVAELFSRMGEDYFRTLEAQASAALATSPPMVVAPGGGWMANERAVAPLAGQGRIILLRVRPETALERLQADMTIRPLLQGSNPLDTLMRFSDVRSASYAGADAAVETDNVDVQEVIRQVTLLAAR
ncbi:MAG: shikimate kinase [Gemmatimonadota bacterium]|nr:shikimate kinase [Gemmatimonadota bacterium]